MKTSDISYWMYQQLRTLVAQNRIADAKIVKKAIKIISPEDADVVAYSYMFEGYWKARRYSNAIKVYHEAGSPFWCAGRIAKHYVRQGAVDKAIRAYRQLLREYAKMAISLFPHDLYTLGKLYVTKNPKEARRYLRQCMSSKQEDRRFTKWHKERARALLSRI